MLSDSGYTNKEILSIFLDYIILHTNAGLDKPPKVLLIDRSSHMDPEFTFKAIVHNIHLYPWPPAAAHWRKCWPISQIWQTITFVGMANWPS
jgi:hypothetical protein